MCEEIKHISDFFNVIVQKTFQHKNAATIVFRGEPKTYPKPCYPNLFRKKILENNEYFEKNQFDEMAANHLIVGNSYLEKAIDAQHGGFPSRLLDVTYNCLVALYFAVTPFYYDPENKYDNEDGKVYIFPVKKMYCPTANNINKAYEMIINRDCTWLNEQYIFQKNHKLIDHIKLNSRIIAQQGAFILFQGDEADEIPSYQYEVVNIKGEYKANLRKELKDLCGIHTGSIYPEKYNLVDEIVEKSNRLNAKEFSLESELDLVIINLKECVDYYGDKIEKEMDSQEMLKLVIKMEKALISFKKGIEDFKKMSAASEDYDKKDKEAIDRTIMKYNQLVKQLIADIKMYLSEEKIELSEKDLII